MFDLEHQTVQVFAQATRPSNATAVAWKMRLCRNFAGSGDVSASLARGPSINYLSSMVPSSIDSRNQGEHVFHGVKVGTLLFCGQADPLGLCC